MAILIGHRSGKYTIINKRTTHYTDEFDKLNNKLQIRFQNPKLYPQAV